MIGQSDIPVEDKIGIESNMFYIFLGWKAEGYMNDWPA